MQYGQQQGKAKFRCQGWLKHLGMATAITLASSGIQNIQAAPHVIAPKLLIISMFQPEAQPWQDHLKFTQQINIPGLNPLYPAVHCTRDDICQVTTGMGYANVATTLTTVLHSQALDLRKSYFLVAGIAGINPNVASTGSVAWSDYVVDFGLAQEFDAREKPADWPTGYVGIGTFDPAKKPALDYQNEVFALNPGLTQRLQQLTAATPLTDAPAAVAYRASYTQESARRAPFVLTCTTMSGNTWWHGDLLGARATAWGKLLTDGKGEYCTTQQEDNATLTAITRAAQAGLADVSRVAVLRAGSNFDRPHAGQSAEDSLRADSGAFDIARENLYRVGNAWVADLVTHWSAWR